MTPEQLVEALMLAQSLTNCEPDKMDSSEAFQTIEQGRKLAKIVTDWIRSGAVHLPGSPLPWAGAYPPR